VVPYPIGRGLFVWGVPLWVPPDATAADMETKRLELEVALNRITAEADDTVGRDE
jgi:lysophospholipid acyltransferase (LPLAT)-like uncharacterized protein